MPWVPADMTWAAHWGLLQPLGMQLRGSVQCCSMQWLWFWLVFDAVCMPYHCLYVPDLLEAAVTPSQLHPALTWALLLPPTELSSPTHVFQGCLVLFHLLLLLPGWCYDYI
jgi:hypothetical protein